MVIRLDKILSNNGYGSRKEIRLLAKKERIRLNQKIIKDPSVKINVETDEVEIDGIPADLRQEYTLMLNKPADYVSSNKSEGIYPSVMNLIEERFSDKLKVAGRLDADSCGLLILTTSGKLIHEIINPNKKTEKKYLVKVKNFDEENIQEFHNGIQIEEDFITKPVTCFNILEKNQEYHLIELGITEGKFHQVKRMFAHSDAEVFFLKRISIGEIILDESLSEGCWRFFTEEERNFFN